MSRILDDAYEGCLIAGDAVRANPVRSALTMTGIVIGIVTITLMGAFLIGMSDMFHNTFSFMGTDVYYVDKFDWNSGKWNLMRNRPEVTQAEAAQLRERLSTAKAVSVNVGEGM